MRLKGQRHSTLCPYFMNLYVISNISSFSEDDANTIMTSIITGASSYNQYKLTGIYKKDIDLNELVENLQQELNDMVNSDIMNDLLNNIRADINEFKNQTNEDISDVNNLISDLQKDVSDDLKEFSKDDIKLKNPEICKKAFFFCEKNID